MHSFGNNINYTAMPFISTYVTISWSDCGVGGGRRKRGDAYPHARFINDARSLARSPRIHRFRRRKTTKSDVANCRLLTRTIRARRRFNY